ncbi:MAG: DNA repair protein RadA [Phycisphaerae bacterium]|nr:DNA repair protein RadA [Phycisphaerae bacterium]
MARAHQQFVCESCGAVQPRWMGKCPDCGEWNSLVEQVVENSAPDLHRPAPPIEDAAPVPLREIQLDTTARWNTGLSEFDRVLGGGIVPGSAVLLGGDPGIGKSTLLLQVGHALASAGRSVVYVTSEESLGQTRMRATRLRADQSDVVVMAQANLDVIMNQVRKRNPDVVIVDSIQMVYRPDLPSAPGSATQLRDAGTRLVWLAKQMGFALLLVGHVTKEGAIAGPKILEHVVDCVAYFEGDRYQTHRIVRAVKNRYGSTEELGIFEMTDAGLQPVRDPATLFLDGAAPRRQPGSAILAAAEGTRVLLVEVQALCVQSVFGAAKRKTTGVDAARVAMILAVVEKHARVVLGDQDVFVNIVGGVRVAEPAADLAIALAVVGAMQRRALPAGCAIFGELGLGGEVRAVSQSRQRIAEAQRVGLTRIVLPARTALDSGSESSLVRCGHLGEAIAQLRDL